MLREKLIGHHDHKPHEFRWRSREISRLEGLSDAVFGFAVTLLIVALEVPETAGELLETMRGFISFGLTFAMLYALWYRQFIFFRRYGLEDKVTAVLNGALLFMVLFFVFPLKFIFGALVNRLLWGTRTIQLSNGEVERIIRPEDLPAMMTIYGLGVAAVFGIFGLLYAHAWRQRGELGLNELEAMDTRHSREAGFYGATVGFLVAGQASLAGYYRNTPLEDPVALWSAGAVLVFAFFMMYVTRKRKRQRGALVERIKASGQVPEEGPGFQS